MKLTFVLFLILFFFVPTPAFAHVLKSSGSIGAVMHIQPDDDPIAGEESGFFFEFKDTENKFDPTQCDCTFRIEQNGNELHSQLLFQDNSAPSLNNVSAMYTFPTKGVYTIVLAGTAKAGQFAPFRLEYDVRVARTATEQPSLENKSWITENISIIIGTLLGLSGLAFVLLKSRKHENVK